MLCILLFLLYVSHQSGTFLLTKMHAGASAYAIGFISLRSRLRWLMNPIAFLGVKRLLLVLLQRSGRIQATLFEQPFDIGTFATEVDVHIHCVIDASRSQDILAELACHFGVEQVSALYVCAKGITIQHFRPDCEKYVVR